MSPHQLDPEDLRDEEPPAEVEPTGFTRAESNAAAVERAAIVVDAVGRGPALPCSAPRRLPYAAPRYGWSCDPDGPACARAIVPRRERRVGPSWHSPERDGARRLDGADLAAWARAERAAPEVSWYTYRRNVEPPPLRQVGVAGDLASALADITDAPRWVSAEERLAARVRAVIETKGTTRAEMLAALTGGGA